MHSNIRNRLFSLLLTFAMLCSLLPATALAAEEENSGELSVLADESLSLTGYCGADTSSPNSTIYQYSDSNGQQQEATYYSNATWKLESIGTLPSAHPTRTARIPPPPPDTRHTPKRASSHRLKASQIPYSNSSVILSTAAPCRKETPVICSW